MAELPKVEGKTDMIVGYHPAVLDAIERIKMHQQYGSTPVSKEETALLTFDQFENIIDILSAHFPSLDPGPRERKRVFDSAKNVPAQIAYASLARFLYHPAMNNYNLRTIVNYWREAAAVSG